MYVDSNNSGGGLKGLQVGRMRCCDIFNMALVLPPAAMLHAHVVVVTGPLAPHGFALGLPLGSLIVGFALPQVYYSSTKMLRFLFAQAFLAGLVVIGSVNAQGREEDVARPPTVTKVWIEIIEDDEHPLDIREETTNVGDRRDNSGRNLQQFLPYCKEIQTEILCTNLKTNKDCSTGEIVPYNKNGCYLYLKYNIAISNKGSKDAKISGITRQLNGEERDFSTMINKNFILKPRHRINISRTEYVDFCKAHNFIGAGAEVLANVGDQSLCVEHGFYVISGDLRF